MTAMRPTHNERGFFMDASIDYVKDNLPCKTCEHCRPCQTVLEVPADIVQVNNCAKDVDSYILGKGCVSYTAKIEEM